jgi:hypothetical protein
MTESELISYVAREAKVAPATAARVLDVLRAAELLDRRDKPTSRRNGRGGKGRALSETEIRARLVEAFDQVKGMEIEDVFGRLG